MRAPYPWDMPIELVAKPAIQLTPNIVHVFHHCMFNVIFLCSVFESVIGVRNMVHVLGILGLMHVS